MMKRGIVTLLSVLALALAFAGCGEEDGAYSQSGMGAGDTSDVTVTEEPVSSGTPVDEYVSKLGISEQLGTPPGRP